MNPLSKLKIYNSISREKETFEPINAPHVGMYVCGPTVYNDVHLGNCRTFMSFDLVYRYLTHIGYKVRYVRNITDVGHLVADADCNAESKIDERARLEKLEPMEIVQKYTNGFHYVMNQLNTISPSIEPTATGHIIEQIEMVQKIIDNGYGYEVNGSVYFDVIKFSKDHPDYGKLSGKILDDLLEESRDDLKNQSEKRNPSDFAIWVKAAPTHLMRWSSPWSVGFPGWHLECSAMSTKYLGERFDIHGGGMDLQFPHHENEIAQNIGCCGVNPVKYWMHGNMMTLNGKKMSKSVDHYVLPGELFSGQNKFFKKAYSPMALRFLVLQTHYRSTLDLTEKGLDSASISYQRLMETNRKLQGLKYEVETGEIGADDIQINKMLDLAYEDMNDDFNTAKALSRFQVIGHKIKALHQGRMDMSQITPETLKRMQETFNTFLFDVFGLIDETADEAASQNNELLDKVMGFVLDMRQNARENKDWTTSDQIRDRLADIGIQIKDSKAGATWKNIE